MLQCILLQHLFYFIAHKTTSLLTTRTGEKNLIFDAKVDLLNAVILNNLNAVSMTGIVVKSFTLFWRDHVLFFDSISFPLLLLLLLSWKRTITDLCGYLQKISYRIAENICRLDNCLHHLLPSLELIPVYRQSAHR